tara:strand:+ start:268 stop:927 length:660 start_codon:yes stop_codon:yes gene_type:complete
MLVSFLVFFFSVLILFMYIGAKLSVKLDKTNYKSIFWVLMVISFITILEIVFCFFLYVKFRNKNGEIGPRGFQGNPGNLGDPGKCDQDKCKEETILIMIQKIFEKKLKRPLNNTEMSDLFEHIGPATDANKISLAYALSGKVLPENTVTPETPPENKELKVIGTKIGLSTTDNKTISELKIDQVKKLHENLTKDIELGYLNTSDFKDITADNNNFFTLE